MESMSNFDNQINVQIRINSLTTTIESGLLASENVIVSV